VFCYYGRQYEQQKMLHITGVVNVPENLCSAWTRPRRAMDAMLDKAIQEPNRP